jgi:hypothetical protein
VKKGGGGVTPPAPPLSTAGFSFSGQLFKDDVNDFPVYIGYLLHCQILPTNIKSILPPNYFATLPFRECVTQLGSRTFNLSSACVKTFDIKCRLYFYVTSHVISRSFTFQAMIQSASPEEFNYFFK